MGAGFAVRHVPWFGPLLADELRALLGSERVTQLEETVAGVEDRVQQVTSDGKARSLSDATPSELSVGVAEAKTTDDVLMPHAVGAMYPRDRQLGGRHLAAHERSRRRERRAVPDDCPPGQRASVRRAVVFALDLSKLSVHAVAGSVEPKSAQPMPDVARPGVIPRPIAASWSLPSTAASRPSTVSSA